MSPFLPETWPFSLKCLPDEVYLVGGSVRDQLLQREAAYLDLDFVLPVDAVTTAFELSKAYGAGFVVLDEARQIARVVFDQVTVDFAQQQGESIEIDLHRRDFTVNAIAYDPRDRTLIDPLGGEADLKAKEVRMVSFENLLADPLRLMRAYRQAAQLGFTVSPDTQTAIGQLAPKLQAVSIERVRSELEGILCVPNATTQLIPIWQQSLLDYCLPHFNEQSIEQMGAIDRAVVSLQRTLPDYATQLHHWLKPVPTGFSRSWVKAAKLSCLFSADPEIAATELTRLKYSRTEAKVVLTLLKVQPMLDGLHQGPIGREQQFFLFKMAGQSFPAVSLLALAQGIPLTRLQPLIEHFLDPSSALAHAPTLVTGNVLISQLGLTPGPKIGELLRAVEQAQARGDVSSQTAAIAWLQRHIAEP
ncbi:MAG: CCA tRNA nucleotidyltransferase [Cyanobacteria bacterium J06626_6]